MKQMEGEAPKFSVRKRSDRKLSVILSIIVWFVCLAIDWLIRHLLRIPNPISSAFVVVTLSLLNAFGGFTVWRRLTTKEKWIIGRAIIGSVLAMIIVPFRAGPLTPFYAVTSVLGITLGAYFAMPIQRLVISIERQGLKRNHQD